MSVTLRLLSGAGRACWFYHQCPVKVEGDAGAAPACAVLRTAGYADHPIACGGSEGTCTPGGALGLSGLKGRTVRCYGNRSAENGAASGSRTPFPSLATKCSAVKPMLHVLHASLGLRACRPLVWQWARWVTTDGLGPTYRRENGRLCGCCPRSRALKGRRPS
jgi:hypothetical protein